MQTIRVFDGFPVWTRLLIFFMGNINIVRQIIFIYWRCHRLGCFQLEIYNLDFDTFPRFFWSYTEAISYLV